MFSQTEEYEVCMRNGPFKRDKTRMFPLQDGRQQAKENIQKVEMDLIELL